ncbi:malonic semialdehyde reductase [Variovorax sp. J2P1-59]|uniref:malonic semialdehyde reductase n=1 Tax=Variovorax flavidus TaxID=3053501 RepID=UPI0025749056|nr:malonic semialdehyde reductase [Variovorax sp. J2P1-59]MDM0078141.1 malonic semialdehyde reductase [Variovorax sp. J2P1-59]
MDDETRAAAQRSLFHEARTHNGWLNDSIDAATLRTLYELASLSPTAMNCQPMRLVFLTSASAKARLVPALSPGNLEKTLAAPVTAIVAYDIRFYEWLRKTWHNPAARDTFAADEALTSITAIRNSSIQAGFLIVAARALGLDCGPMSGFDSVKVDAEFFSDSNWRSNFLCNLGRGDPSRLLPRQPRLEFDEACQLL